ncbi:MAG: TatD family hydrolase [Candidatus Nomurabacteria bacterium]|jgi:TatD DNase family protein|nr:TatD family hydrolase [Candidatus Nomurabacteria bacterium]
MLIDTHCHVHDEAYPLDKEEVLKNAFSGGVKKIICIGTSLSDSERAVRFAKEHDEVYATVGIHPSENDGLATKQVELLKNLIKKSDKSKLVAVGEIGLDYHYQPYDKTAQIRLFEEQLQVALDMKLPVVFHVREAFFDTFSVIDNFSSVRGVLHSFTGNEKELAQGLLKGFYISLNGIATFSKDEAQLKVFDKVPMDRLLLETDAPYLTPKPLRGKMNEPRYVKEVARWVANRRGMELSEVEETTSVNAIKLFNL